MWLSTYFVLFGWFFKIVCLKDNLRVDVWDFNDEESVNDKFGKINQVGSRTLLPWWIFFQGIYIFYQVKDGRGLRKFIKETLHATAGKKNIMVYSCQCNILSKVFALFRSDLTWQLSRQNLSRASGECRDPPKEHPCQWGGYLLVLIHVYLQINLYISSV